jgi:2-phospho-L-lactate guanylyltransferase
LKTSAIIPVKSFSKAKTRLNLPQIQKEDLCLKMFDEVLRTISSCKSIDKILVVSNDEQAIKLSKQYNTMHIFDNETGVNDAMDLANQYLIDKKYDCSIMFPQDIPIMKSSDIDNIFNFFKSETGVLIVPSRQFNGTNALLQSPVAIMNTQYERGSYKHQLDAAKTVTKNTSIALIRRIMLDIDDLSDLSLMLNQNEKPDFCKKIVDLQNH